jgi:hypothetical protein
MTIKVSKNGIFCVFFYAILIILYMLILPYGDEPDFNRRGYQFLLIFTSMDLHFFDGLFDLINSKEIDKNNDGLINTISHCGYGGAIIDPRQLFGAFDYNLCLQNVELALKRVALTLVIFLPLIIISITSQAKNSKKIKTLMEYSFSKESISLSLIFPGFIYYSSVFSPEQITLMLSVLFIFFLFQTKYIFAIVLFSILYLLDTGNAIVVFLLTFYIVTSMFIYKKGGLNSFVLFNLISLLVGYNGGQIILPFLSNYSAKMSVILSSYTSTDVALAIDKWPLISRPIMTFMSYNLMPPSMAKHPLIYIMVSFGIIYTFFKHFYSKLCYEVDFKYLLISIAVFSGISICVFLMPGYTNAKYYIFTLPLFINSLLQYYSFKTLLYFFLTLNIVILVDYLLFYLIW